MPTIIYAESIADAQAAIRSSAKICIVGKNTKKVSVPASCECDSLDLTKISGIVEYDPSEFTITARAGTRLEELDAVLSARGQFLPFDPPLMRQGSTVGGMIAAGISGPSRLRFGSVRDFVLSVKYIDGLGALATAGGKVVKNAAGFDIPKLLVGSWGELAAIVEVTLKVFPRPVEYCSVRIQTEDIEHARGLTHRLTRSTLDIDAIDIEDSRALLVRLGGLSGAVAKGAVRAIELCGANGVIIASSQEEERLWSPLLDWSWCGSEENLVRVPLTTSKILELESQLRPYPARCRYSVAGNLAWIAWPNHVALEKLDRILMALKLVGRIVRGEGIRSSQIGLRPGDVFANRIRQAMDPKSRFARRA